MTVFRVYLILLPVFLGSYDTVIRGQLSEFTSMVNISYKFFREHN